MIIISVILSIIFGGLAVLYSIKLMITNSIFKEYLLSIGDEKTRGKIGLIVRPIFEVETMMEKKYKETTNESYLQYSERYRELIVKGRIFLLLLFGCLILYVNLTN